MLRPALALCLLVGLGLSTVEGSSIEDETPLEQAMGGLQQGQRKLRKLLEDPAQKAATLATVRAMQASAAQAFVHPAHTPEEGEPLDGPALEIWQAGYKQGIAALMAALVELELAVLEDRAEDAQAHYAKLGEIKKRGHDTYQ